MSVPDDIEVMNVCTTFHDSPSKGCGLFWTDRQNNVSIHIVAVPIGWLRINVLFFFFFKQRCDFYPALELNHFLFTGPTSCCPSSHVRGFAGNSVSITKHGQPTEAHEERLGHPPNQCPRELTRPLPARACPGNAAHPSTCRDTHTCTHTNLTTLKRKCLLLDMTTL